MEFLVAVVLLLIVFGSLFRFKPRLRVIDVKRDPLGPQIEIVVDLGDDLGFEEDEQDAQDVLDILFLDEEEDIL